MVIDQLNLRFKLNPTNVERLKSRRTTEKYSVEPLKRLQRIIIVNLKKNQDLNYKLNNHVKTNLFTPCAFHSVFFNLR